jgi:hypothetical protein
MKKAASKATRKEAATTRTVQLELPTPEALKGALFGLVIDAGLASVAAMLELDRVALCGPRYQHDAARRATRGGHTNARPDFENATRRLGTPSPRISDS